MSNLRKISSTFMLSLILIGNVSAAESTKDIKIEINGKNVVSDVAPFIDNDRTLVPIRVISENLGYSVNWDNQTRKVTVKNNDKSIELTIGRKEVNINGTNSSIDVAPMIKNERTFVPLRFISESFDNDVNWDNNTRTVRINKKGIKVASIFDESDNVNKTYSETSTAVATKQKNFYLREDDKNEKLDKNNYKTQDNTYIGQNNIYNQWNDDNKHNNTRLNDKNKDTIQLRESKCRDVQFLLDLTWVKLNGGDFINTINSLETEIYNIKRDLATIQSDSTSTALARRIKLKQELEDKTIKLNKIKTEKLYLEERRQILSDLLLYNKITNDSYNEILRHNENEEKKLKDLDNKFSTNQF